MRHILLEHHFPFVRDVSTEHPQHHLRNTEVPRSLPHKPELYLFKDFGQIHYQRCGSDAASVTLKVRGFHFKQRFPPPSNERGTCISSNSVPSIYDSPDP